MNLTFDPIVANTLVQKLQNIFRYIQQTGNAGLMIGGLVALIAAVVFFLMAIFAARKNQPWVGSMIWAFVLLAIGVYLASKTSILNDLLSKNSDLSSVWDEMVNGSGTILLPFK